MTALNNVHTVNSLKPNLSEEMLITFYSLNEYKFSFNEVGSIQLANIFLNLALVQSSVDFIKEQCWIAKNNHSEEKTYENILTPFFLRELAHLDFLSETFLEKEEKGLSSLKKKSLRLEKELISHAIIQDLDFKKAFINHVLSEMTVHYLYEEENRLKEDQDDFRGVELYRIFDRLDEFFELDYTLDREMKSTSEHNERIFSNSGVGVQSGYSTILLALNHLELKDGMQLVELGSGYGRVGLVSALLRPKLNILGYEFVPHRVEVSQKSCKSLGLLNNLEFKVQDLSEKSFRLPEADIFYMYDPFNAATYEIMISQILEISKKKKVAIVTKGNAKKWFLDNLDTLQWPAPEVIDNGNLCIFSSSTIPVKTLNK